MGLSKGRERVRVQVGQRQEKGQREIISEYPIFLFSISDQGVEVALSKRPSHENSMNPLQRLIYKGSS